MNGKRATAEDQFLAHISPCDDTARAGSAQTLINTLKQKDGTREAYASIPALRPARKTLPTEARRSLGATTRARRFHCSIRYATMAVDAMGEKVA